MRENAARKGVLPLWDYFIDFERYMFESNIKYHDFKVAKSWVLDFICGLFLQVILASQPLGLPFFPVSSIASPKEGHGLQGVLPS